MKVVSEQRPNISEGKSTEDISRTCQSSRDSKCEDWGRNVSVVFKEQQGGQCTWSQVSKGYNKRWGQRENLGPEHVQSCKSL